MSKNNINTADNRPSFGVQLLTGPSKVLTKETGAEYVLYTAEVLDGPLEGDKITVQQTTINAEGLEKDTMQKGDEAIVFVQLIPSNENPSVMIPFFELSSMIQTTDNATLVAKLSGYDFSNIPQASDDVKKAEKKAKKKAKKNKKAKAI